jgi:hypothetical protein
MYVLLSNIVMDEGGVKYKKAEDYLGWNNPVEIIKRV